MEIRSDVDRYSCQDGRRITGVECFIFHHQILPSIELPGMRKNWSHSLDKGL